MVGESNDIVFLIQKDASSFAEFEISEFEILRVDSKQCRFSLKPVSLNFFQALMIVIFVFAQRTAKRVFDRVMNMISDMQC